MQWEETGGRILYLAAKTTGEWKLKGRDVGREKGAPGTKFHLGSCRARGVGVNCEDESL